MGLNALLGMAVTRVGPGVVGDDVTFGAFVDAVEPRLRLALVARYGPERGREATAEALAWAWEHRDRLGGLTNPMAYLYRVGQSRTRVRRLARGLSRSEPQWDRSVEPRLMECLQGLTERQRVCVVLVHGYGWTLAEVADLLGVAVATVQTHAEQGLDNLRIELGATNDG